MNLVSCIVMMSGRVVYASCLSSSRLFVMLLMFNCSTDMPVTRGVFTGFCGMFLGVVASFQLFACVGVECCVGVAVWFRTCILASAPECGLAECTSMSGLDSTRRPPSKVFALSATGRETWPARLKREAR